MPQDGHHRAPAGRQLLGAELRPGGHRHPVRPVGRAQRRHGRRRLDRHGAPGQGRVHRLLRLPREGRRGRVQQEGRRVPDQGRRVRLAESPAQGPAHRALARDRRGPRAQAGGGGRAIRPVRRDDGGGAGRLVHRKHPGHRVGQQAPPRLRARNAGVVCLRPSARRGGAGAGRAVRRDRARHPGRHGAGPRGGHGRRDAHGPAASPHEEGRPLGLGDPRGPRRRRGGRVLPEGVRGDGAAARGGRRRAGQGPGGEIRGPPLAARPASRRAGPAAPEGPGAGEHRGEPLHAARGRPAARVLEGAPRDDGRAPAAVERPAADDAPARRRAAGEPDVGADGGSEGAARARTAWREPLLRAGLARTGWSRPRRCCSGWRRGWRGRTSRRGCLTACYPTGGTARCRPPHLLLRRRRRLRAVRRGDRRGYWRSAHGRCVQRAGAGRWSPPWRPGSVRRRFDRVGGLGVHRCSPPSRWSIPACRGEPPGRRLPSWTVATAWTERSWPGLRTATGPSSPPLRTPLPRLRWNGHPDLTTGVAGTPRTDPSPGTSP